MKKTGGKAVVVCWSSTYEFMNMHQLENSDQNIKLLIFFLNVPNHNQRDSIAL